MMKTRGQVRRKSWLLASAAFAAFSAPAAIAQESEATDEEAVMNRVMVTGSRIETDSATTAASPVLSVGIDEIISSGETDITFLLRETPSLNASLPGSFSAFNAGDTEDSDLGIGLLNLRNLGIERTLVLQNGRRHVAGAAGQAAVDTNTIPVAMLRDIEVLTGGASSIYGADAVTGVVNFILRDGSDFDGLEYRVQGGITDEGDAEEFFASIATGFEFDNGRGDAVIGIEYFSSEAVFASERSFAGSGFRGFIPNNDELAAFLGVDPGAANTYAPNVTLPISSNLGAIALGDGGASAFVSILDLIDGVNTTIGSAGIPVVQVFDNGVLRPYNPGDIVVNGFAAVGGDAIATTPDIELILPDTERVVLNANFNYEINPYINLFFEGKYAHTETSDSIQVNGFNDDIPIALDNPFIPDALQAQIAQLQSEGIDPVIAMSRDTLDVVPIPLAERDTFRFVGGINGELPYGVDYELSYNIGQTDVSVINDNTRLEDRFFAAVDAVVDPATGQIVCRSDLDSSAVPPTSPFPFFEPGFFTFDPGDGQCAPINLFGAGAIQGPGADFAFQTTVDRTELQQEVILATLGGDTGAFFELPGGAVGWAAGVEYRRETSDFRPDPLDTAGLTFGATSGGPTFPSDGDFEVIEGFVEAKLPLLADLPLAELVEVSGSARFSSYNTIGRTNTWSVGGRYQPHEWVTFRGTYSEAVRAPNIGELFSPQQPETIGADEDPCNANFLDQGTEFRAQNCLTLVGAGFESTDFNSAFVPGVTGGNPDLNAEEATTFTVGTVLEPGGPLEGLQIIADFYDIEITGAIDDLDAFD
ncbi:MAG: TonB-dependent receptor, partial [Pseudomonadota bacterium]